MRPLDKQNQISCIVCNNKMVENDCIHTKDEIECNLNKIIGEIYGKNNYISSHLFGPWKKISATWFVEPQKCEKLESKKSNLLVTEHDDFILAILQRRDFYFENLLLQSVIDNIWVGEIDGSVLFILYNEGDYQDIIREASRLDVVRQYFCGRFENINTGKIKCFQPENSDNCFFCTICGEGCDKWHRRWHNGIEITNNEGFKILAECQDGISRYHVALKITNFKDLISRGMVVF
jgi:hypothetical protein